MSRKLGVGIVGCGNISTAYLKLGPLFRGLEIRACADRVPALAAAQAEAFGVRAMTVEDLLAAPEIATYRARQLERDRVEVALHAPPPGAERAAREALARLWAEADVARPHLNFVAVGPPDPSRKERRVERLWRKGEAIAP